MLVIEVGSQIFQSADKIVGIITDEHNKPLSNVSVVVKESGVGTTTDENGSYSIQVQTGQTLIFSFQGYQSQEVKYQGQKNISLNLGISMKVLDNIDVVAVGFGTQKKTSLTSSVSQISGQELLKRSISNIQQALQGQVPGLTILDQGAAPGKNNMVMRIRGITTLGSNEPLVIMDGIEQRIQDINPDDIESISILKDASSTAIYGSRAANGVVLITSKRANKGKANVTYHGYLAWQKSNNNPEHMGLEDYMRLQNIAWENTSGAPIYEEEYIKEYVNSTDRYKYPLPNIWHDVVLHTAPQMSHTAAVSGGNDVLKARLSLRYQDQDGIVNNTGSKIGEIRLNTDYKISSRINLSTDINYRNINSKSPNNEFILFKSLLQNSQFTVPKYPDGTYGISSDGRSPLVSADLEGVNKITEDYITGSLKGEWKILDDFTFTTQIAGRVTLTNGKNYRNKYQINDYFKPEIVRLSQPINNLTEIRNNFREFTFNNLLNYSKNFNTHSINALAGYSQIANTGNNLSAFRQNFYNNDVQSIGQGANDATKNNTGNEYNWGLRSYFGRINYAYQNKYLFEANARYDGSSRFINSNKYSFFPSFSAGWRISQEKFWENLKPVFNELKIRGSWGMTGNQAVDLYSYLKTLSTTTYSFNGAVAQGYLQTTMANQNLTWETTTQSDIGLDGTFFNNKVNFTLDYYYKKTDDILLSLPVPGTLGLLPSPQNAGRMDNMGWEFLVGIQNNIGNVGFNGNIFLNINDNKVINLAGTGPYIKSNFIIGEGYPINSYWSYKTDGYFQSEEEVASYPNIISGVKPGDVKFIDLNKDGKITADDMTYLGRSFPKYTFGSNINLKYKGFTLNILMQGVSGYNARIEGALLEMGIWGGYTHKIITNNYWTPENRNARFPRPLKFDNRNIKMADRDLVDGAYFRIKNVQLNYQLPSHLTKKVGIEKINLYVAGTNLITFSKLNEWNVDPETTPGTRTEAYPQTSLSTIGLNIQF